MDDHHGVWLESAVVSGPPLAERYAALIEQIPAVLYVDLPDDDDTTVYVSPQLEHVLGIDPDHYVNAESNPWEDHLHPADRERAVAEYRQLLARGGGEHEYRMIRPDTCAEVWIHDRFVVLGDGPEQIVQGVMVDVSQGRRDQSVIADQLHQLERAEQIGRTFTQIVVDRGDLTHVLEILAELVGNPVILVDNAGQISALADAGLGVEAVYQNWEIHARSEHVVADSGEGARHGTSAALGAESCLWQDVVTREEPWGRLHVLQLLRELDPVDAMAVDRAVVALGMALLVEREAGHLTESARAGLLADLAHDRIGSGMEFLRRSRALGIDLGRGDLAVVIIEPRGLEPHTERNRQLARSALLRRSRASLAASGWRALSALEGDRVIAVVAVPQGSEFTTALAPVADPSYYVGASDVVRFSHLSRAYRQAAEAAAYAVGRQEERDAVDPPVPSVTYFEDLGLIRLLSTLADGPDLRRFVETELGALVSHDRTTGAPLLPTLRSYLAEHGSKTATAKRLHVERRTVYYRLERIGALLVRDLDDAETRLRLEVAIRGHDLISSRDHVTS